MWRQIHVHHPSLGGEIGDFLREGRAHPSRLVGWALALLASAFIFSGASARAAAREVDAAPVRRWPLVVVIGATVDDPLAARVAAELRCLPLAVGIRATGGADASASADEERALLDGADAAVHVDRVARRIEVAVADPVTRGAALRQVVEALGGGVEMDAVLALRAVEFVRVMLIGPSGGAPPTTAGVSGSTSIAPAPLPAEARRALGLTLLSGLALAAGGLGPQAELGLHVRVGLGRVLAAEIVGFAPLTTEGVPGAAAMNARASVWLAGAGFFARRTAGRNGGVEIGGGGLAVGLRVAGDANTGWSGGAETRMGAAAYGRAGGVLALSRALALRVELLTGSAFRRPIASAGGPGVYAWGHAFGLVLAGVEARWY